MPPRAPDIHELASDVRELAGASDRNAEHIKKLYEKCDADHEDIIIIKIKLAFMSCIFGLCGGVCGSVIGGLILWAIKGK